MHELHLTIEPSLTIHDQYGEALSSIQKPLNVSLLIKNKITSEIETAPYYVNLLGLLSGVSLQKNEIYFNQSVEKDLYIFSCDCGISECAGIFNGLLLKNKNKFITWKLNRQEGYKLQNSSYVFTKDEYINTIKRIRHFLIDLERKYPLQFSIQEFSIPEFFKRISLLHVKYLYNKVNLKNNFSCQFFIDEHLNDFNLSSIKGLTHSSVIKKLHMEMFEKTFPI